MRASSRYLGDRRFETAVGKHTFMTDNTGAGPTPPDFFVASLAACIGIYVSGFCEKIGLDPSGMTVELEYEKTPTLMTDFAVRVRLPHAVLGPRAAAVQRVAEACFVHRTIRTFGACPITIEGADAAAA